MPSLLARFFSHPQRVIFALGLGAIFLTVVVRAVIPLEFLAVENTAALNSRVVLKPGHTVRQSLISSQYFLSRLALRLQGEETDPRAQIEITVMEGDRSLAHVSDTIENLSRTKTGGEGEWIIVPLRRSASRAETVEMTVRVDSAATGPVALRIQHDGSKYPDGDLTVNGRVHAGDLAFQLFRQTTIRERLFAYFFTQGNLWEIPWIVLLTCTVAFGMETVRRFRRGVDLIPARPFLLFAVLALAWTFPFYLGGTSWGIWDWSEAATHYRVAQHSLSVGQFPLWNPYVCGGVPHWANPQAYWPSLTFLLTLPFGLVLGSKIALTTIVFLGLWGTYALARELGRGTNGALFAAVVFMLSGFLAAHLAAGQLLWLTLAWFPWMLVWLLRSFDRLWSVVPASLFALLIFMAGRVHLVAYAVLFVPLLLLSVTLQRRRLGRGLLILLLFALTTVSLGAIKILPTLEFLSAVSGQLPDTDGIPWMHVGESLLTRTVAFLYHQPWMQLPWHEYAGYVGVIPLVLALVGIAVGMRRFFWTTLVLLGGLVVFGLWMTTTSQQNLFEQLPVVAQLRNPGRALSMTVLIIALLAGAATDLLARFVPSRRMGSLVALGLTLAIACDFILAFSPAFAEVFSLEPKVFDAGGRPFYQTEGSAENALHVVNAGYGARDYCPPHLALLEPITHVRADSDNDYRGEVESNQGSEVTLASFTPNHLSINVGEVPNAGDTLIVNQRFSPGWRSADRDVLQGNDGRITVPLRPEDAGQQVTLFYRPYSFLVGAFISFATLLVLLTLKGHTVLRLKHGAPRS